MCDCGATYCEKCGFGAGAGFGAGTGSGADNNRSNNRTGAQVLVLQLMVRIGFINFKLTTPTKKLKKTNNYNNCDFSRWLLGYDSLPFLLLSSRTRLSSALVNTERRRFMYFMMRRSNLCTYHEQRHAFNLLYNGASDNLDKKYKILPRIRTNVS